VAPDDMRQIGEVAEVVGLSLRTIRHYEEVGVVPPSGRTQGGFRLYTDADIERLRLVKHMKPLDFSLDDMRDLLGLRDRLAADDLDEDEERAVRERIGMYATAARTRCERLQEQLETAQAMAELLEADASRPRGDAAARHP